MLSRRNSTLSRFLQLWGLATLGESHRCPRQTENDGDNKYRPSRIWENFKCDIMPLSEAPECYVY